MTELLLENGANINAFDRQERRALHWAAFSGHDEIVKLLLEHGADPNAKDKQVCTSLL